MGFVTYTARDSLISGHTAGTSYDLALTLTDATVRSVEDLKTSPKSLSGKSETLFFGQVESWDVELYPVRGAAADAVREFLDSTADGQEFVFDPYGTADDPSDWSLTVVRDDNGYTEPRTVPLGTGGEDDYHQFKFRVRTP